MRRLAALLVVAALAAGPAQSLGRRPPAGLAQLPKSELSVVTASGTHRFTVWIADNEATRARGLMFVRSLPADHGMLFLFERTQHASFWMKDTYLSLDLIFIGGDGVVVRVAKNAKPMSLDPIPSGAPVNGVLEVVAGTAARIGLAVGDRVTGPAFSASQGDATRQVRGKS